MKQTYDYRGLAALLHRVRWLQYFAAIVAEILILAAFFLSGMDVSLGGTMTHNSAMQWAWAAIFSLGVDTSFVISWVRCRQLGKSWHLIWSVPLALCMSFVVFEPVAIQLLQQALNVSFTTALAQLGINLVVLVYGRTFVAVAIGAVLALTNVEQQMDAHASTVPLPALASMDTEPLTSIQQGIQEIRERILAHPVPHVHVDRMDSKKVAAITKPLPALRPAITRVLPALTTAHIYQLVDPRTDLPFYVGQTMQGLRERLNGHIHDDVNVEKQEKIAAILAEGMRPRIESLEEIIDHPSSQLRYLVSGKEREWIERLYLDGHELTNMEYLRKIKESVQRKPTTDPLQTLIIPEIALSEATQKQQVEQPEHIQRVTAILTDNPSLSVRKLAEKLEIPPSTAYNWIRQAKTVKTVKTTD